MRKLLRNRLIPVLLVLLLVLPSTRYASAHQATPPTGNPSAPAHNEDPSPGFRYDGWVAPFNGYFSIYQQGYILQQRFTITLSRVGAGSGGGSYQAVWTPAGSGLNRFDTPIRINAGETYNIAVYEQELDPVVPGWHEGEGWLPPRVTNLGLGLIACGIGNHPFNTIISNLGGTPRFLSWNVYDIYTAIQNDLLANNPAVQPSLVDRLLIKPPSVGWGDPSLGIQCWGDNAEFDGVWRYRGVNYSDDIDFEDFLMVWAYNPTTVSLPAVTVQINGATADYAANEPASYTVSWFSSNVTTCNGADGLVGLSGGSGQITISGQTAGNYSFSMHCTNGTTMVSDTRQSEIHPLPAIDVKVDGSDTPPPYTTPADFNVQWLASAGSQNCSGSDELLGATGLSGSVPVVGKPAGTYRYTMTCDNGHGAQQSDTVEVQVNPLPPVVDLQIDGSDGPLTLTAPASYLLSWSSTRSDSCTASSSDGRWSGAVSLVGNQALSSIPRGNYTYSITCQNLSGSASDTVSVQVNDPLSGTISASYARLLLFAPNLGQPAQTLTGLVSGGTPPYSISVWVRTPSRGLLRFVRSGNSWSVTPGSARDPNFGTTEQGVWSAWAEIQDSLGQFYRTVSVIWEVAWYPVHGLP